EQGGAVRTVSLQVVRGGHLQVGDSHVSGHSGRGPPRGRGRFLATTAAAPCRGRIAGRRRTPGAAGASSATTRARRPAVCRPPPGDDAAGPPAPAAGIAPPGPARTGGTPSARSCAGRERAPTAGCGHTAAAESPAPSPG